MDLLPKSNAEWRRFIFFPFRAFVLLGFLGIEVYHSASTRIGDWPQFLVVEILGCMLSFAVFVIGGIVQLATRRGAEAANNFLFAGVTVLIWWHTLRHLASA